MKKLEDLFLHMLKDVYHAEKQILRALPKMAKNAESDELRTAFETHREETAVQVERLEQVFELLGKRARGEPCEAIQGLIEEGKEIMEEAEDPDVMDAGLIAAAQAIEHYEIARYGTLKAWADQLGMKDAARLIDQTLQEEKKTDQLLSQLAVSHLNQEAA
ncbi:MAG TPA: ferritin-like domain-containing protein [Microvirga sp.]|jgi:ferritin-like metal-binding protein YciE|nr:ferritin-like domain-containing protein [Microvirga sp.]